MMLNLRNTLIWSLMFFVGFIALFLTVFNLVQLNDALDSFVISGSVAVLLRYGRYAWGALRVNQPNAGQMLIVSICGICMMTGMLRLMRQIGLELGVLHTEFVAYSFALITAIMVWSIFLMVIAPPVRAGEMTLTPWVGVIFAIIVGSALFAIVAIIRYLF